MPDVRGPVQAHHVVGKLIAIEEDRVPLIQVKVVAGVFTTSQKQEIIERLTDALVCVQGENLRRHTWCVIEEVGGNGWGVGGEVQLADDIRALGSS